MEFKKFSSLENTYRQNLIDKVQYEGKAGGVWIVTEKIHGANFSFWCDGNEVKVASRSQFVDGTFYNCQTVINRYSEAILNNHKQVFENGVVVVVYGELFGQGIQKEVVYGEKDFRAFDLVIDGVVQDKIVQRGHCETLGIQSAPFIKTGSLKECLEVPNTFQSLLTPEGFEGENISEGVVIEPIFPRWFNNGTRIYFKNKTESFSEKKREPKEKKVFELSEEESELLNSILEYNTEQRVSNVVSKIGTITNKDFGKILGLTVKDILEDFTKDTSIDPKVKAEDNWKDFAKLLQAEVTPTVRSVILPLMEV